MGKLRIGETTVSYTHLDVYKRQEEKSALIRKKLEKGKTISEIADDLEDTEENIAHLIEQFHLHIN